MGGAWSFCALCGASSPHIFMCSPPPEAAQTQLCVLGRLHYIGALIKSLITGN